MGFGFFHSLLILILFFRSSVSQNPNTDEFFLYNFLQRMGLNSTKGYDFSGSFCSWKGVSCNSNGENVVKLQASGLGLSGVIADNTIGKLKNLEFLDLSCNEITGLSTDFWSLSSLKILNLSLNQISGILPSNIGNFGQLKIFDLSDNVFSGIIPEAISSLVSLQVLNLSKNGFESNIPLGISQCQWITSIDLARNKLNGSLPSDLLSALPMLRFLNLADNEIDGRDSDFLGMKMISYLNISGNLFKGSVVGVFTGPLEEIDLSRNQFDGHISQVNFVSTFNWSHVVYLDLSENQFSGQFFTEFNHAENLKHLNLAHNKFTEQRFLKIDKLSNLEYLNLSATNLVGRIPSNVSRLSSLRMLDLSKNHLTNHIPWFSTKNLRVLDVSYNNLTGEIPLRLLQELPKMERFNFSYNELSFCASIISPETTQAAFIGSVNSCPIAANPAFFKRKARKHRGLELALVLALSMVCLLVGLLFLAFGCRRRSQMRGLKGNSCKEEQTLSGPFSFHTDSTTWVADVKQATSIPVVVFEKPLLNFTFADLLSATANFDRSTLLAEGRFGPVYDGVLPGGVHIAVKVLVCGSTMTDQEAAREFEYLGRVKHPNLVPLMGYCLAGEQRIAIYDCTENGNLHNLLYNFPLDDRDQDRTTEEWSSVEENEYSVQPECTIMTWQFRHKIVLGVARALAFLHHGCSPPIIHRDVKPSSIYLDSNLEPRLSDFGLAKIFGDELDDESEYGSTGYLPPELVKTETGSPRVPTTKSDVYGFGVILLELITGRKPIGDDYDEEKDSTLVSWVRRLVRENKGSQALDPKISGAESEERLVEALKIGYLCTAKLPSKRPSMQQVVGLLKDLEPHPPE